MLYKAHMTYKKNETRQENSEEKKNLMRRNYPLYIYKHTLKI